MHRIIVATVLLFLVQSSIPAQQRAGNERRWQCRSYSGKGNETLIIEQAHPLQWFAEHLPEFDSQVAWRAKNEPGWNVISAEIVPVGEFAGRQVDDVLFRIASQPDPVAKLVVIGSQGQFRPVVWTLADFGVFFVPSMVVKLSDATVLVNRDRVSGTGYFFLEDYFVFDGASGLPVRLEFDTVIHSELEKMLPSGVGVRKGGGFNIQSLQFKQSVWKDGDANCCPAAGTVEIQLAIRGNAAEVINSAYHPSH
jgi:hypothetical protein